MPSVSKLPTGPTRWATILGDLDDADRIALSDEVDRTLSGRIRDIALTPRLHSLCRRTSWRQRSRIVTAWLTWAMLLSIPMMVFDWLYDPSLLWTALIVRGPLLLVAFPSLIWMWSRPRRDWVEGLTLTLAVLTIMVIAGALGLAGGGPALHQYMAAGVLAASTAVVIFPVTLTWTMVGTATVLAFYLVLGLFDPASPVNATLSFCLFCAVVLGALVLSRRTMNIIQQHSFLLNLRSILQTEALAKANRRLAVLANTDALTGLANRRAYEDEARRLWADSSEPPRSLGVILFDIDHFKHLNDKAGHAHGDQCLMAVAREIERIMPHGSLCARYGGEEFICVLSDATPRGVQRLAEELRAAIEALAWPNPGIGRPVTVSIGVSVAPTDRRPESLTELVRAADAALYRAKDGGRNRIAAAWETSSGSALAFPAAEPLCA